MKADFNYKNKYTLAENFVIEKILEISDEDFIFINNNLLESNEYIQSNQNFMFSADDCMHCLMLLDESGNDGLLVYSEGYDYPRYSAYISNARQLAILDKYPSLNNFIERIAEVTEDILSKASAEPGGEYIAELEKYNTPGEPYIYPALIDYMLTDSGMVEDTILHNDSIELCLTEQAADSKYRQCYDANWTSELEIICAKHALWIYDEQGGERADFSNCLLENVNLLNCNLCGADFSGAIFVNCNLDDASMCDADFRNAQFTRCSLRHFTAEEADFKGSDFYNCDLRGACFTHSNFSKSKMADCNFHEVSFMNCCLESWISTDCNLKIADMRNVSYDESEWLSEQNEEITMGGI